MKKYLLLALFFIFFSSAFTQGILRRGFIVLNNGDTIQCEIAADLLIDLKDRVHVRHKDGTDDVVYTPDKLLAFHFDPGNVFESVTVEGKSFFLRRLVKGHFSLYSFPQASRISSYYLKKNDGTFVMLVNTITNVQVGERSYKKQGYEYVASLKLAMIDRPDLIKHIEKARLEDEDLADIVKRYNNAKDRQAEPAQISEKRRPKFDFGVLVGYSKFVNPDTKGGVRAGILASLRSAKDRTIFHYNMGVFYNTAEYKESSKGQTALEFPIYISFYPIRNAKLAPYVNVGVMPSYYSGYQVSYSVYGEFKHPYNEFVVPFMIGTGTDIKIKKEHYLKVDVSLAQSFLSVSLGYMF